MLKILSAEVIRKPRLTRGNHLFRFAKHGANRKALQPETLCVEHFQFEPDS